jgi:hypothetical protein
MKMVSNHGSSGVTSAALGVVTLLAVMAGLVPGCSDMRAVNTSAEQEGGNPTSVLPTRPPIDLLAPDTLQTATFAFG